MKLLVISHLVRHSSFIIILSLVLLFLGLLIPWSSLLNADPGPTYTVTWTTTGHFNGTVSADNSNYLGATISSTNISTASDHIKLTYGPSPGTYRWDGASWTDITAHEGFPISG